MFLLLLLNVQLNLGEESILWICLMFLKAENVLKYNVSWFLDGNLNIQTYHFRKTYSMLQWNP